jgi:hypothetical protein
MEAIVPASLLSLPEPWRNLEADVEELLDVNDAGARTAALQVLDRCLQALEELPAVSPDEFPDFVTVAWSLWSSSFATLMPSFDEFCLEPIEELFRKQDPGVTDTLVCRYALAWLRKQASSLADVAKTWLFDTLRASPDAETLAGLRSIVERHWLADQGLAFSILYNLWGLDRPGSTALLEKIAGSPDASPELKELKLLLAKVRA